jgi:hypothetical protein
VANLKRLWRRRKTLTSVFIAAVGSFLVGVTLPVNLRSNQPEPPPQAQIVAVSQPQVQKPNSNLNRLQQAIGQRVEFSQQAIDQLQENRFNSSLPSQFRGITLRQARLDSKQKAIALTFDDGPWPTTTTQILDKFSRKTRLKLLSSGWEGTCKLIQNLASKSPLLVTRSATTVGAINTISITKTVLLARSIARHR